MSRRPRRDWVDQLLAIVIVGVVLAAVLWTIWRTLNPR